MELKWLAINEEGEKKCKVLALKAEESDSDSDMSLKERQKIPKV